MAKLMLKRLDDLGQAQPAFLVTSRRMAVLHTDLNFWGRGRTISRVTAVRLEEERDGHSAGGAVGGAAVGALVAGPIGALVGAVALSGRREVRYALDTEQGTFLMSSGRLTFASVCRELRRAGL